MTPFPGSREVLSSPGYQHIPRTLEPLTVPPERNDTFIGGSPPVVEHTAQVLPA